MLLGHVRATGSRPRTICVRHVGIIFYVLGRINADLQPSGQKKNDMYVLKLMHCYITTQRLDRNEKFPPPSRGHSEHLAD